MRTSTDHWVAAMIAGLFLGDEVRAQPQLQAPGEYRIYSENDAINPFWETTDRYYTQGLRFEWLSSPKGLDAHFLPGITHEEWCSLVCGRGFENGSANHGFAAGQNMYTPEDITVAAPQPFDRPWAGHLYGSRIARVTYQDGRLKAQRQDRIEISLGIVGPASLAKETQIWWHDRWGFKRPNGWDNQLRNEPVLQLRYETAVRCPVVNGRYADFIPRVRANAGNALVSLEAEATGRIGWNLSSFGVAVIPSGVLASHSGVPEATGGSQRAKWFDSGNLFVRAGLKAVAHNIFLDGNSFADNDIRIDRKLLVPEIAAGVELNLVGNFWLSYQLVHRGSEFEDRRGRDAPAQDFGAITIALRKGG